MKSIITVAGVLILLILFFTNFTHEERVSKSKSIALVELFTSEGCSSCPAADKLLKEMTEKFQTEGKEVISLAFHITYWNNLGWADPYSQETFTVRQKKYRDALKLYQLYTPQAVVNGYWQFVGSNPTLFKQAIDSCITNRMHYRIDATGKIENNELSINYNLNKAPKKNTVLNIAVAQRNIEHAVPRGENKDKILRHYNVVRNFTTVELQEHGSLVIPLDNDLAADNLEVVIYVQQNTTMKVMGASKISL